MRYYFRQIAPKMDWKKAKAKLWRSVDSFGKEGSRKKASKSKFFRNHASRVQRKEGVYPTTERGSMVNTE